LQPTLSLKPLSFGGIYGGICFIYNKIMNIKHIFIIIVGVFLAHQTACVPHPDTQKPEPSQLSKGQFRLGFMIFAMGRRFREHLVYRA
jgi:hypothetical protein